MCRSPGSSMAQCWIRFRIQFQDSWSRRHPVLGLVAPRTLGGTPGSVYLARGGPMLSVLRPATMEESYASRGQRLALAGLPEPMQVVHSCVQMVSSTLGPWALESALQLAIAGGCGMSMKCCHYYVFHKWPLTLLTEPASLSSPHL